MEVKLKYELEFPIHASPSLLYQYISTPSGMSEWFADNVIVEGDLFTFFWNQSSSKARLSALKENKLVRFDWIDSEDEDSNFFEFRINIEELSGSLALIIAVFPERFWFLVFNAE